MSIIRVLSDQLVNQIAAGEVVERPASVAKELVENAVDAGARRIEVDVEAGGRRLLRVADDGCGMTRDDALLAFERHATSKISRAEDLNTISTLGFRGEALASIASVARVELVTQLAGEAEGTRVLIEGGRMRDVQPCARPRGTTLTVRDLFFNTPARRKFLRSEATESFHLTNLVTHYALAHPEISFTLTNNGREVLRAAPAENLRERAYQIFGDEFIESLLAVAGGDPGVARVSGFVSAPSARRTTRDAQYLFVNGRYVRDRLVAQSLLVPETFDLTPAQAAAFEEVSGELEGIGFSLTRLSGRTVAVRAVPADLTPAEARNLLAEILDTVDAEKRGRARETLREEVAASLACHAAIKVNMPLTEEKMRWLIDRLLLTSSPTTCPHGRPAILRLTKRDIERGFHRP